MLAYCEWRGRRREWGNDEGTDNQARPLQFCLDLEAVWPMRGVRRRYDNPPLVIHLAHPFRVKRETRESTAQFTFQPTSNMYKIREIWEVGQLYGKR